MKLKIFFVATVLFAFAACKTPYKATDRPTPKVDNTVSTTDSMSSPMNKIPLPTDSAKMSAKIDSIRMPATIDSIKMPSKIDSVKTPVIADSTMMPSKIDSIKMRSTKDSTKMPLAADSVKISSTVQTSSPNKDIPAATQTAFTKQYPGATNTVWSNYDSLAAVPIDLRMAGWKKMDAGDHLAKFDLGDENYYAWYASDGKWVGSAYTMKDLTKLPVAVNTAVKNAIKTRYAGYTISNVNREFQKDKKTYEVELKKDDNKVRMLVNADGKITQVFKYAKDKTK